MKDLDKDLLYPENLLGHVFPNYKGDISRTIIEVLATTLNELDDRSKSILYKRYLQRTPYTQIGDESGVPQSDVSSIINNALQSVRSHQDWKSIPEIHESVLFLRS